MSEKKREHSGDDYMAPSTKRTCVDQEKDDQDDFECLKDGEQLWTSKTFPKPSDGHLLLFYLSQCVNRVEPDPMTVYRIPVKEITDDAWSSLVAAHNFFFTVEDQIDDFDSADDRDLLQKLFVDGKLHDLLKQFEHLGERGCVKMSMRDVTAIITTGFISD